MAGTLRPWSAHLLCPAQAGDRSRARRTPSRAAGRQRACVAGVGRLGPSGIVGPCILQAAGGGYAFKLAGNGGVAAAFFGDGGIFDQIYEE